MTNLPTKLINTITTHTGPINAITFSSQGGKYILTGSSDKQIHLSRTEPDNNNNNTSSSSTKSNTLIQRYKSHGYAILDLAVSKDNQTIASCGGDRSIFLWDIQSNTPDTTSRRLGANSSKGHTRRITCVEFLGQGDEVLVSGSDDRSLRFWDLRSRDPNPLMVLEEAKDSISSISIPEGFSTEIISGSIDSRIRSYDIRMGKIIVDVMPGSVTSLDLTKDGKILLVSCLDSKLRIMDRLNGTCLKVLSDENHYKNTDLRIKSCFALNESLIISGNENVDGDGGGLCMWDVITGEFKKNINFDSITKGVVSVVKWREGSQSLSRRGVLAAGGVDGMVRIYGF